MGENRSRGTRRYRRNGDRGTGQDDGAGAVLAIIGGGLLLAGCSLCFKVYLAQLRRSKQIQSLSEEQVLDANALGAPDRSVDELAVVRGELCGESVDIQDVRGTHVEKQQQGKFLYVELEKLRVIEDKVKTKVKKKAKNNKTRQVSAPSYVSSNQRVEFKRRQSESLSLNNHVRLRLPPGTHLDNYLEMTVITDDFEQSKGGNPRTVGYRYVKRAIPSGIQVYAIGRLGRRGPHDSLTLGEASLDTLDDVLFVLSEKHPFAFAQSLRTQASIMLGFSVVVAAVGTAGIVTGLVALFGRR